MDYEGAVTDLKFMARFWSRVEKTDECWLWAGQVDAYGYGEISRQYQQHLKVHIVSLTLVTGRRPEGAHAGHICHDQALVEGSCTPGLCLHRRCVNPSHLVWQSPSENNAASGSFSALNRTKTHCSQGHEFTADNLLTHELKIGERACRKCNLIRSNDRAALIRDAHKFLGISQREYISHFGQSKATAYKVLAGQLKES